MIASAALAEASSLAAMVMSSLVLLFFMARTVHVQFRSFPLAEMVPLPLAPLAVTLFEGCLADQTNALTMPEGRDKEPPRIRTTTKKPFRAL